MNSKKPFSFQKRFQSFSHAMHGLKTSWLSEHNFRIHIILFTVSIILGVYLKINRLEWGLLIIASSLVLISELFNTAIESICDFISPQIDPRVKKIKDVAAAAVLIAAIGALIIGIIVFLPQLI